MGSGQGAPIHGGAVTKRQLDGQVISDKTLTQAHKEWETLDEEYERLFWETWTKATTDSRLYWWNTLAMAGRFGITTTNWSNVRIYEIQVGYTFEDLKKAVLRWYADPLGDRPPMHLSRRATQVPSKSHLHTKVMRWDPSVLAYGPGYRRIPKYFEMDSEKGR